MLTAGILGFTGLNSMLDRAKTVKCAANLRTIGAGTIAWAVDRSGYLWSREEFGYSKYRMVDDPLSPSELMKDYLPDKRVWQCPAGRSSQKKFGNNYTWSLATQYEKATIYTVSNPHITLVFWDAYQFSLPSMFGAGEVSATGATGPATLSSRYQVKPHHNKTKVNWLYLDGHVELK